MKTYEEVAKSVFEKSEKYFEEKALKAKRIKTAATAMSCFCLAAVITVGAIAVLNGNLTEYPVGGRDEGQSTSDTENNINITDDEATATETEPLTTTPYLTTGENDVPFTPDANAPDNIMDNHGEVVSNGVFEPFFIAFDGALYVSYDSGERGFYEPTGLEAYLAENYTCKVCCVQGRPDHIGVDINSFIHEYKKVFDCDFEIDGQKYQIAYSALKDIDHACGDIVLQTEDFTVYEAVRLQGEPSDTKEYIVDLLPVLKREFPNLFDELRELGFDDYGDAWWIALPAIPEDIQSDNDVSEYSIPDDPSLPNNTLVGVTPKDTDQILAAAQAVSSEKYYRSVFVLAETGNEIYSLVDGTVVMAEYNGISGYFIEVETADGRHIRHSHLSEMLAEVGDTVTKDQVIGLAGTTGYASCSGVGYCFITG